MKVYEEEREPFLGTEWTFEEIAEKYIALERSRFVYCYFMRNRFDAEKEGQDFYLDYSIEWVRRFGRVLVPGGADVETLSVIAEALNEYERSN